MNENTSQSPNAYSLPTMHSAHSELHHCWYEAVGPAGACKVSAAERATSIAGQSSARLMLVLVLGEMERILRSFLGRSPKRIAEIFVSAPNHAGSLSSSSAASASTWQPTHSLNSLCPPPALIPLDAPPESEKQYVNRRILQLHRSAASTNATSGKESALRTHESSLRSEIYSCGEDGEQPSRFLVPPVSLQTRSRQQHAFHEAARRCSLMSSDEAPRRRQATFPRHVDPSSSSEGASPADGSSTAVQQQQQQHLAQRRRSTASPPSATSSSNVRL